MKLKALGGALALVALVTACGSGGATTTSGAPQLGALSKKVDVTFWDGLSSGAPLTQLKAQADAFNASQTQVTVHIVDKGDYTSLRTAELTSLAAGSPPDIGQCYENWAAKFAQSNALADMQPFIDAKDGLSAADKKDIFPTLFDVTKLNGKQLMFPFNKSTTVVYYNKDLLAAKGINNPPATWDELFTDATAVTDKTAGVFGVAAPAIDTWLSQLYEYGGTMYDNDKSPKKSVLNSAVAQQITQKWADAVKAGSVKVVSGPGFPDQVQFQNGKSAFYIASIASYSFIKGPIGSKFKYAEAPFPAGPKGTKDDLFGTNVCIFSKASQDVQHGAFLFVKYFTGKDPQVTWSKTTGYMPDRQSSYDQLKTDIYSADPNLGVGVGMLAKGQLFLEPPTTSGDDQRTAISTELGNAFSGNKSVQQALNDMVQKCNDLLTTG